jgi:hypothetical protein
MKIISVYVGITYIAVIVALFGGWCRPFNQYLVLQPANLECATWRNYNILQMSLNISSDMCIILVPIYLVVKTRFPLAKKLGLVAVFGLGGWAILASVFKGHAVLTNLTSPDWMLWSIREVSTVVIVGNAILCFPLLRWIIKSCNTVSSRYRDRFLGETKSGNRMSNSNESDRTPALTEMSMEKSRETSLASSLTSSGKMSIARPETVYNPKWHKNGGSIEWEKATFITVPKTNV